MTVPHSTEACVLWFASARNPRLDSSQIALDAISFGAFGVTGVKDLASTGMPGMFPCRAPPGSSKPRCRENAPSGKAEHRGGRVGRIHS
jgi:hypothetical protein